MNCRHCGAELIRPTAAYLARYAYPASQQATCWTSPTLRHEPKTEEDDG